MKTLSFKNSTLAAVLAACAVSVLAGCGATKTNPHIKGYEPGVLPHDNLAREQKEDICGFSFSVSAPLEVVEGGTFKQDVTIVGTKSFPGGLALQGEPKGMTIATVNNKNTITYVVPRGIVPNGQNQASFEYTVLPATQENNNTANSNIECSTTFKGTVTVKAHPSIAVKNAPTAINLDNATKSDFQVNVNASDIKSNESLSLALGFDKSLDAAERPIFDLSQALVLDKNSLPVNAKERMFTINLDPAKMNEVIVKKVGAKSKRTEFIFVAVLTAKNEESKVTYSKNIVVYATRTLPAAPAPIAKAVKPAAKAKAGKS